MRPPRPDFLWNRLGRREMPADELQRIDDGASRGTDEQGGAAGDAAAQPGMALELTPPGLRAVWGRIADPYTAEGTPPALYYFEQIAHDGNAPVPVVGGVKSVALEVNGNVGVPTYTVCLFWPSEDALETAGGEKWRFVAPAGGTDTVENYYNSTFNYYETTLVNISDTFTTTVLVGAVWIVDGPGYVVFNAPFVQCGWIFWCWQTVTVTTSQLDDWAVPSAAPGTPVYRLESTADFAISGMVAVAPPVSVPDEGTQALVLANCSGHDVTLLHEDASSADVNRFHLEGGADLTIEDGGIEWCWYDPAQGTGRWKVFRAADPGATDQLVKIDAADTTAGYLADGVSGKLIAGTGILFTIDHVGGNETLTISATGAAGAPAWVPIDLVFGDFAAASFSNTVTLYSLAAGGVIHGAKVKHSASFTGGAISNYVVTGVGVSGGSTTKYYTGPTSIFVAPTATGGNVSLVSGNLPIESQAAATTITISVQSTGAFLNAATAGALRVWLLVSAAT